MRGRRIAVLAAVAAVVLSGCGGGDDSTKTESKPKAKATAPAKTAEQLIDESICSKVDVDELVKAFDGESAFGEVSTSSDVRAPSFERCSLAVGETEAASSVNYAWSITKVSPQEWADFRKRDDADQGRYLEAEKIDVGDGGYTRSRSGYTYTDQRILRVSYNGASASKKQLAEALELAVPTVADLPFNQPVQSLPACDKVTTDAELILGSKAVVRRDTAGTEDGLTDCGWATKTASIEVTGSEGREADLQLNIDDFGGEEIAGLGKLAAYFGGEDGSGVQVFTDKGNELRVQVPALIDVEKADLIALAKKVVANY